MGGHVTELGGGGGEGVRGHAPREILNLNYSRIPGSTNVQRFSQTYSLIIDLLSRTIKATWLGAYPIRLNLRTAVPQSL